MNKKLFLTSMAVLGFASPMAAFAYCDTCTTVEMADFPEDGILKENTKYLGGAGTVLYSDWDWNNDDTVYAVAIYGACPIDPGYYMPAGMCSKDSQVLCESGYYCPNVDGSLPYSETETRGRYQCPQDIADYGLVGVGTRQFGSAPGSTKKQNCYVDCRSWDVRFATEASGVMYWGHSKLTCNATKCIKGFHLVEGKAGTISSQGLVDLFNSGAGRSTSQVYWNHSDAQNTAMTNFYPYAVQNSWGVTRDITPYQGSSRTLSLYGLAMCAFPATGTILSSDYTDNSDAISSSGSKFPSVMSTLYDSRNAGSWCWCKLTAYKDSGNGNTWNDLYSPWLLARKNAGASSFDCLNSCASICANMLYSGGEGSTDYRAWTDNILYAAGGDKYATCERNTINVEWSDATEEDIIANKAGTITYDENIRTPVKAIKKDGLRFMGWKLFSTKPTE